MADITKFECCNCKYLEEEMCTSHLRHIHLENSSSNGEISKMECIDGECSFHKLSDIFIKELYK